MEDEKLVLTASDISISEQRQNDVFMYVGMRVASTRANKNNEGVTEGFIDSVIEHQDVMYNCLPLYVDLCSLKGKRYNSLTHLFDRRTGRFGTTQIGALCNFSKQNDEYGVSLMAEARIPKRERDVCLAMLDLYACGCLNFSFEISYDPACVVIVDGVSYVDASERNVLKGVAVVSVPAYRESTALSLVAEEQTDGVAEDTDKGDGANPVDKGEANMTEQTTQNTTEQQAPVEQTAKDTRDDLTQQLEQEKASVAQKDAIISERDATIEQQTNQINDLTSQLSDYHRMKAELDAVRAEQEAAARAEKQRQLKALAERLRLNTGEEAVSQAINSLNYEALVSLANNVPAANTESKEYSITSAGDSMKVTNRFGDLLDRK